LALLISNADGQQTKPLPSEADAEDEDDYEIPDEIEEIIDELLTGLRSSETIIRWSAAKGNFLT